MQFEITRTTTEVFRTTADNPFEARDKEREWVAADEQTSIREVIVCVGTGELVAFAPHPKFPDCRIELTDELIKVHAKNGDVVFSARVVQDADASEELEI